MIQCVTRQTMVKTNKIQFSLNKNTGGSFLFFYFIYIFIGSRHSCRTVHYHVVIVPFSYSGSSVETGTCCWSPIIAH